MALNQISSVHRSFFTKGNGSDKQLVYFIYKSKYTVIVQ